MKPVPKMLLASLVIFVSTYVGLIEAGQRANIDIVLYESGNNGGLQSLEYNVWGIYSPVAIADNADGPVVQIHPMGLCRDEDFALGGGDQTNRGYGSVVIIKLEASDIPPDTCMTVYNKAKLVIESGASAVILDISNHLNAARELEMSLKQPLKRPVVLVEGQEAVRLRAIVGNQSGQSTAHARIRQQMTPLGPLMKQQNTKEYFIMGVFAVFFILCCCICLIIILKLKQKFTSRHVSPSQMAKRALSKMKTRRYKCSEVKKSPKHMSRSLSMTSDLYSSGSNGEMCAICLDQYEDGQILRILPCCHEFHKGCVDPWLIKNHTCPLCLYDIVDPVPQKEKGNCSRMEAGDHMSQWRLLQPSRRFSAQINASPLHSTYVAPQSTGSSSSPRGTPYQLYTRLDGNHLREGTTSTAPPPGYLYQRQRTQAASNNHTVLCNYDRMGTQTYTSMVSKANSVSPFSNLKSSRSKALSKANAFRRREREKWYYGTSSESEIEHAPPGDNLLSLPAADRSDTTSPDSDSSNRQTPGEKLDNKNALLDCDMNSCTKEDNKRKMNCTYTGNTVILSCNCAQPLAIMPADCQNDSNVGKTSGYCSDLKKISEYACRQSFPNTDCSNQSTFGSSDLPSDISNQDYNAYNGNSSFDLVGYATSDPKDPCPMAQLQPACLRAGAGKMSCAQFICPESSYSERRPKFDDKCKSLTDYSYQPIPDNESVLMDFNYASVHDSSFDSDLHSSCLLSAGPSDCQSTHSHQPLLQSQNSVFAQAPNQTSSERTAYQMCPESNHNYIRNADGKSPAYSSTNNITLQSKRDVELDNAGVLDFEDDEILTIENNNNQHIVQLHSAPSCGLENRAGASSLACSSGLQFKESNSKRMHDDKGSCGMCIALNSQASGSKENVSPHLSGHASLYSPQRVQSPDITRRNSSENIDQGRGVKTQGSISNQIGTINRNLVLLPDTTLPSLQSCQYEAHSPWVLKAALEDSDTSAN